MKALIFTLGICLLSGCASFRDAKTYEMKKSPCACIDETYYIGIDSTQG